jgi:hypothetical protein
MGRSSTQETLRKTKSLSKPIHDNGLKLSNSRTTDPVEVGAIEGIGVELGESGRVTARAGEKGHEARAGPMSDARKYLGLDVVMDIGPRLRILRRRRGEKRPEVSGLHVGDDAMRGDIFIPVDDFFMSVNMIFFVKL